MKRSLYSFAVILTVLSVVACGNNKKGTQKGAQAARARVMPVTTTKIPTGDYTTYKSYPATIEGIINSAVRPKISGYITKVLVDQGQKVSKGQPLFKLETATLTQQAQAAKANVNVAQVKVNQLKPLVEQNIISESQLATAKAQLEQAKSSYQSVKAQIGYANIKSPVNGYVGMIPYRKGNLVSPSSPKPLTTVADISKVYVYFSMNEKDYLDFLTSAPGKTRQEKIKNLPKVTLIMANGEVYEHKGTIETINSQVDPQTGTVSYRAVFDNPKRLLTNGSTGIIKIPTVYQNVLAVPQKATFERQGRTYVMKIERTDSTTVANIQPIHVMDASKNLFLIDQGLKEGDEIIAAGASQIRPGTAVKPTVKPFDSVTEPLPAVFN